MEQNESEKIIRETIEYANQEITKVKRKNVRILAIVLTAVAVLLASSLLLFVYEFPVAYQEGLVEATIPVDAGIDIHVNLPNYKRASAILIETEENSYDLYIGVHQTLATKLFKDWDTHNNFIRVGNGLIYDHQSERLWGFIPEGKDETAIQRIYYMNALSDEMIFMNREYFINCEDKTLIWERNP